MHGINWGLGYGIKRRISKGLYNLNVLLLLYLECTTGPTLDASFFFRRARITVIILLTVYCFCIVCRFIKG